ncbi:hypothetical protein RGR602_PC01359 (plasmid) [Rhizobium gallicum bv. gallicum R602sp]|uniref:Uncharacterized protein n=1 Tax=Rhizobium gallicum bv. gallicum R602sp TaxID=1041138 RepID=A0A0B4XE74_9HYPH|nr:hypothetical protein RGR602_PC01359 [Rhizobium gallicum bv. gallicum R602sp]
MPSNRSLQTWSQVLDEEKHLVKELSGYDRYRREAKHRLVPGIWSFANECGCTRVR